MKKLLAFLMMLAGSAVADPKTYATDMAIYRDEFGQRYFYALWHEVKFGNVYVLQYSEDATNWTNLTTIINDCCPGFSIWAQQTPITHSQCLFRVEQIQ